MQGGMGNSEQLFRKVPSGRISFSDHDVLAVGRIEGNTIPDAV